MGRMKNLEKINPAKRNIVYNILTQINDNQYVNKVIIFGSSIRPECNNNSDLDVAIGWNEECFDEDYVLKDFTLPIYRIISKATHGNNDIIPIGYEGQLKQAINNGVVVYEQ